MTVAAADQLDCTFTNVRKATVTLRKSLSPSSDSGRFNLKIGTTTVVSAAGDGSSGSIGVVAGTYTVKEAASSGRLANYTSSISCTKNGNPYVSGSGTSQSACLGVAR